MTAIASILQEVEERTKGDAVVPAELWSKLAERFALIGVQGIVRMAMAGFDVACWDALAVAAGVPLVRLLGGEPRRIPAYNSCGLGLMPADALADEAEKLLERGFRAIKLRLGYPTLAEDIAAVHAVKKRIPPGVALMVDYNQALSLDDALARGRALDRESIAWLEEPIRHDDYAGAALIARELAVPVQIGENFSLLAGMQTALNAKACDLVMPDLERIGGVSGWQQRGGACREAQDQNVIASLSGDQRASARGDADRAFPGIRRLGRQGDPGAAPDRRRRGGHSRPAGPRHRLGQGGGRYATAL